MSARRMAQGCGGQPAQKSARSGPYGRFPCIIMDYWNKDISSCGEMPLSIASPG